MASERGPERQALMPTPKNPGRRALVLAPFTPLATLAGLPACTTWPEATMPNAPAHALFESLAYEGSDPPSAAPPLPAGHFRNPILSGAHPDPSICRVGSDYYLATSTFALFPGITLHHSRDLVHWRPIGAAITRPGSLRYAGLPVTRGLFAPALSHHAGRYYLVCTMVGGGGNFIVTADRAEGPWSEPVMLGFEGIDPALFFDDDGSAWMLNNGAPEGPPQYEGHRAIWQQAFDAQTLQLTGPRRVLVNGGVDFSKKPVWIEGPHIVRREGWYYLCAAEGGTSDQHSQVVLRSRRVTGPYEPWSGNPTLTQRDLDGRVPGAVTCTGHADLVIAPDGHWWAVFLGCRPLPEGHWLMGRETFLLPVRWTADGWPQILPAGQRVPLGLPLPAGASSSLDDPNPPRWQADFRRLPLGPEWMTLRAPPAPLWTMSPQGLQLQALPDALNGLGHPATLLRRMQHQRFSLSTTLQVPGDAATRAGLTLFQSEKQFDWLSVQRGNRSALLRLQRCDGGSLTTLAERELPAGTTTVSLRARVDERRVHYDVATSPGAWQGVAADLSHRSLSVQAAGGGIHFTGLMGGLHAQRSA